MKKVEMFESKDGVLHKSKTAAIKREELLERMANLLEYLGGEKKNSNCDFANGGGYYQLTRENIEKFDKGFIVLVKFAEPFILKTYFSDKKYTEAQIINSYALGRSLCDSNSPLYRLHSLRLCIDSNFKRWGQPYFANNPSEGKQIKLG